MSDSSLPPAPLPVKEPATREPLPCVDHPGYDGSPERHLFAAWAHANAAGTALLAAGRTISDDVLKVAVLVDATLERVAEESEQLAIADLPEDARAKALARFEVRRRE